jgi:phage protein D
MAAKPDFQPIYEGRDFYVPAFDIKVKGTDLPKETARDVLEVKYIDSIDKIDTFEMTINNWDAGNLDFKYTGSKSGKDDKGRSKFFQPGQVIEVWMGYFKPIAPASENKDKPEPLRLMLAGTINTISPTFPAGGQPTLKVGGQSVLSKLSKQQQTFAYGPKIKPSDIALKVGQRGNLKIEGFKVEVKIDETARGKEPELEYMLQDNQFDIVFLLQLGHRFGYDVFLKDETKGKKTKQSLFFGPPSTESNVPYTLEWGRSLIQFQPTLTTTRQVNEVEVRGWDALKKKEIKVKITRAQLEARPLRDKKELKEIEDGFKEKKEIIVDKPFRDAKEAEAYARDRLTRLARDMVTARGTTLGTADLRAGSRIEIKGLGRTFDGNYFIKSTTHTIGAGGYITDFDARLEEAN